MQQHISKEFDMAMNDGEPEQPGANLADLQGLRCRNARGSSSFLGRPVFLCADAYSVQYKTALDTFRHSSFVCKLT